MESNNAEMRVLVNELTSDKKSASHQKNLGDNITGLMTENQGNQGVIKEQLNLMTEDISDSKKSYADEPETRVKQTVYRTLATKFRDVLRQT